MPSRSIIRTGVGPHREPGNPSRPWRRRSISSPRERLAFSRDETSVDPSARSSITPTQSLDSIVRGRALTMPFTLPDDLPPLRLLLVWDNLTGHKTPDLVLWLCAQGVMPLDTPVGGSWLNMAESIERVLKRRALDGQHPH